MFSRRSRWLCVTAPVVALAFSGWAFAQQTPPPNPQPKPVAVKPAAQPQEKEAKGKDIVETAKEAGSFKTLCELLEKAGLVETLKEKGPLTVFAPTDEAFAKLDKATLEDLKKPESKEKLQKILKYHVVRGKLMAEDVVKAKEARTLVPKAVITITVKEGKVILNDKVNVTKTDIAASNGVIHVVDAVLMPPKDEPEPPAKPAGKPAKQ